MAEYQDRTGYNVGITGGAGGSEPPDTIEAQWLRKLERDLWVRFWGPGVACSDWDDKNEYDRATGWNQSASYDAGTSGSGTASAGMGDLQGHPDSHISAGSGISTTDPRDAIGYGKYTASSRPNITAATKDVMCQITCGTPHGLLDEDPAHEGSPSGLSVPNKIQIVGVPATSMHELNCDDVNNQIFYAKVTGATTLDLYTNQTHTVPYDSSNNAVWAGTIGYINFVVDFDERSGAMNTGNYEKTTTIARDQYIAIQSRINAAIKRTGQSTFATGDSKLVLPLVTHLGAMRKSLGEVTTDINEDVGRVRDDHVNKMSDEIERIGGGGSGGDSVAPNTNTTSLGHFNWHKLHVNGIYAPTAMNNDDGDVYSDNLTIVSGSFNNIWGSDTWSRAGVWDPGGKNNPWSDSGGSDHGNDRPFVEARMTFNDWDHLRYWFNQGGCCTFLPKYITDGSWGGNMWDSLARANALADPACVFAGQYSPYHERGVHISNGLITFRQGGSGHGYGVTGDCPRVHGLGTQANAYFAGGGASTSDGISISGVSTGNMASGDVLHVGSYSGTITSATGGTATLHRVLRNISGTETTSLSGQAWACSKWYRSCQYDGGTGLYGDNSPFPNDESQEGDGGYIHFDWRFVKDPSQSNKPCIFYRMMYDNAGTNCTVDGNGYLKLGYRYPETVGYFYPEQGNPAVTKDNASTAEGHSGLHRV